ncbi:MAG: DUF3341 domain-containing protein [Bryobacteraceae bacterium]|nr:DUF3341 domain-containing protein [Bryobacteraceae bacterium]
MKYWGIVAGFPTAETLIAAVQRAQEEGFSRLETYTPFPVEEVEELIYRHNLLPLIVFLGGIAGAVSGWTLQEYLAVWNYPINVGGRPLNSWPAFVVITFELTILFAAVAAFLGTLLLSRLPEPYHPVANATSFSSASSNKFFLAVSAKDLHYDAGRITTLFRDLDAESVEEIVD